MELTGLEKYGVVGICIAILIIGYKLFTVFIKQWEKSNDAQNRSTEAVNRNTDSFDKLSAIFEKQHEREIDFQKEVKSSLKDTHNIVVKIHNAVTNR